jgi:hypothetical protein
MKKFGIAAMVAGGIGAAAMGLAAPAYAAPSDGVGTHGSTSQIEAPGSGTPQAGDDSVKIITTRTAYLVLS